MNSFKEGIYLALRIQNNSSQVLNVTVLDLQPDWGITQAYPRSSDSYFMPIDPGKSEDIPLKVSLPQGYKEGRDVIKVFATVGPTNFRWLELPVLDQPMSTKNGIEASGAVLEVLGVLITLWKNSWPRWQRIFLKHVM